jgi:hypothetical protein
MCSCTSTLMCIFFVLTYLLPFTQLTYEFYNIFFLCRYTKREVHNLARFISVIKPVPLSWRMAHPYLLADRFEDVTPPESVRLNRKCDRKITLYGYLRGCNMKRGTKVTWPSTFFPLSLLSFLNYGLTSLCQQMPLYFRTGSVIQLPLTLLHGSELIDELINIVHIQT